MVNRFILLSNAYNTRSLGLWWLTNADAKACKHQSLSMPGRRLKNTYELVDLVARKFSLTNKVHIFQYMGKIFCVEFQSEPLISKGTFEIPQKIFHPYIERDYC